MNWNCFSSPVAMDGMDGGGLKLEKICQLFQVDAACSKNSHKIYYG